MVLRELVVEMVKRMDAAGHQTVWATADPGIFVYVTYRPETARAVEQALEQTGLLCHTEMGPADTIMTEEELRHLGDSSG